MLPPLTVGRSPSTDEAARRHVRGGPGVGVRPHVNIEAYLGGVSAAQHGPIWAYAAVAGLGQMVGKLVFYVIGRRSLQWRWVDKKMSGERWAVFYERWRRRAQARPTATAAGLFASAAFGVPPLAMTSVLPGQLRVPPGMFFGVALLGPWIRFW